MKVVSFHLPFLWQLNPVPVLAKWLLRTCGQCARIWNRTTNGWSLRGEFVKCTWINTQAWMEPCFAMNGLYFCFMLDGCLYFSISAYAALIMNIGGRWCNESYISLCHNVTHIVTWTITSYGGAGDKSPAPRAPINRFAKKNSLRFNIEIEKHTHWFNFWTSVTLSVTLQAEFPSIFLDERSKETLLAGYLSVWPNDERPFQFLPSFPQKM